MWQCNEEIFIRVIKNRRTLDIDGYSQEALAMIDIKMLKYFTIIDDDMESFLTKILNKILNEANDETSSSVGVRNGMWSAKRTPAKKLVNYSKCPDLLHLRGVTLKISDTEMVSRYLDDIESRRLCRESPSIQQRILTDGTSDIDYIPYLDLTDGLNMAYFHSKERKEKMIKTSPSMTTKGAEELLSQPFIRTIGILSVEVNSESFLRQFLKTCDTKVEILNFVKTPQTRGDMFAFQQEMSQTLIETVHKISTNSAMEKTCHRFTNLNSIYVENFPSMNNWLMKKKPKITKIGCMEDTFLSSITLKSSFVCLNDMESEPFYCESITAHFNREDLCIDDEGTFMYLGGNMINIEGINYIPNYHKLTAKMNQGKDQEKGGNRLVVLLDNNAMNGIRNMTFSIRQKNNFPEQSIQVQTSSKYIDLKIKKVTCDIELSSNSVFSLNHKKGNDDFIHFLKAFLNGRNNLSSMKLKQALELQIIESLSFDISKYADACKILEEISSHIPSAIRKFEITFNKQTVSMVSDNDEEKVKFENLILGWIKTHSKMEVLVQIGKDEPLTHIHYSPIMHTCLQAGNVEGSAC
jgi:hypothetical protein